MVALSHNNRMLAEVVGVNGGGPISGAKNDKASSDLQIEEIKKLVAAHSDFMAIARSSAELQSIVQGGRLAVVLGVEIDKIGDFNTGGGVTEQTVDDEIARLYNQGVRYIFPIHLTDNAFGDTAIYKTLFNIANFRENGSFWTVGCGLESDEVGFRSTAFPPVLNPFIPPGSPQPPRAPDCLIPKPNGPLFVGHVNARTPNGLTSLGEFAIKSMMKRGMIIDIDHMSDRAANRALTLANFSGGGYPLMSGHTGIRDRNSADARNAQGNPFGQRGVRPVTTAQRGRGHHVRSDKRGQEGDDDLGHYRYVTASATTGDRPRRKSRSQPSFAWRTWSWWSRR